MRIDSPKSLHRIAVYAVPKAGKSRFVTALPWDTWGDAIYVAADRGSECLDGIMPEDREHLRIEKPMGEPGKPFDMHREACKLASTDWSKEEGVGVVIWDTMSQTAQDILMDNARANRFGGANGNITVGRPGQPDHLSHPAPADFGATQSSIDHIIGLLFQQKVHVICVFHADWAKPGAIDSGIIGGPQTVGSAQIKEVARPFSALLHLEASRAKDGKAQYVVRSTPHGIWQANIRACGSMPDMVLDERPTDFWRAFDKLTRGDR